MKAIRVVAFGGPEVLELVDVPEPAPGPGELLLDVTACGLNWSDSAPACGALSGWSAPAVHRRPGSGRHRGGSRSGRQLAAARHASVRDRRDRPGGRTGGRAASTCFPLPDAVPSPNGAAVAVSLLTAGGALLLSGHATAGETVLVHAGGGALGTMAVQVARCLDLRVVATVSSPEKKAARGGPRRRGGVRLRRLRRRGAKALGRTGSRFGGRLHRGGDLRENLWAPRLLRSPDPGRNLQRRARDHRSPQAPCTGRAACSASTSVRSLQRPEQASALATRLWAWLADGSVRPQVGHVLPLQDIRRAHDASGQSADVRQDRPHC